MSTRYTKEHYADMAGLLSQTRATWPSLPRVVVDYMEERMVKLFSVDNPRFSEEKFRQAARPGPPTPDQAEIYAALVDDPHDVYREYGPLPLSERDPALYEATLPTDNEPESWHAYTRQFIQAGGELP